MKPRWSALAFCGVLVVACSEEDGIEGRPAFVDGDVRIPNVLRARRIRAATTVLRVSVDDESRTARLADLDDDDAASVTLDLSFERTLSPTDEWTVEWFDTGTGGAELPLLNASGSVSASSGRAIEVDRASYSDLGLDEDGDGRTNFVELISGSDPYSFDDRPPSADCRLAPDFATSRWTVLEFDGASGPDGPEALEEVELDFSRERHRTYLAVVTSSAGRLEIAHEDGGPFDSVAALYSRSSIEGAPLVTLGDNDDNERNGLRAIVPVDVTLGVYCYVLEPFASPGGPEGDPDAAGFFPDDWSDRLRLSVGWRSAN